MSSLASLSRCLPYLTWTVRTIELLRTVEMTRIEVLAQFLTTAAIFERSQMVVLIVIETTGGRRTAKKVEVGEMARVETVDAPAEPPGVVLDSAGHMTRLTPAVETSHGRMAPGRTTGDGAEVEIGVEVAVGIATEATGMMTGHGRTAEGGQKIRRVLVGRPMLVQMIPETRKKVCRCCV